MDGTEKSPKKKATVKTEAPAKAKKVAKVKSVNEVKVKKSKAPQEELCVFAFRLRPEERDRIHAASGPGGATRLVRSAALAIAEGNKSALDQLLADVKTKLMS